MSNPLSALVDKAKEYPLVVGGSVLVIAFLVFRGGGGGGNSDAAVAGLQAGLQSASIGAQSSLQLASLAAQQNIAQYGFNADITKARIAAGTASDGNLIAAITGINRTTAQSAGNFLSYSAVMDKQQRDATTAMATLGLQNDLASKSLRANVDALAARISFEDRTRDASTAYQNRLLSIKNDNLPAFMGFEEKMAKLMQQTTFFTAPLQVEIEKARAASSRDIAIAQIEASKSMQKEAGSQRSGEQVTKGVFDNLGPIVNIASSLFGF